MRTPKGKPTNNTVQLFVHPPAPARPWAGECIDIPKGGHIQLSYNGSLWNLELDPIKPPKLVWAGASA